MTLAKQIARLPIAHHFAIAPSGVASRQCLTVPPTWLSEGRTVGTEELAALGPLYFRRLPRITLGLIRVEEGSSGIRFRLWPLGLTLLHFTPATVQEEPGGGTACYPIQGGWALASRAPSPGALCLSLRRDVAGLHACMEIRDFHPRLMGGGTVPRSRRLLYTWTQAVLHHWIARDFVRQVALAALGNGFRAS